MDGTSERIKFPGGTPCVRNLSCSSGKCVFGGGSCGPFTLCCTPVSCQTVYCIYSNICRMSHWLTLSCQHCQLSFCSGKEKEKDVDVNRRELKLVVKGIVEKNQKNSKL